MPLATEYYATITPTHAHGRMENIIQLFFEFLCNIILKGDHGGRIIRASLVIRLPGSCRLRWSMYQGRGVMRPAEAFTMVLRWG